MMKTDDISFVPFEQHHVDRYTSWMQDTDILRDTATDECMSRKQVDDMRLSYAKNADKICFVIELNGDMIGDINLFKSVDDTSGKRVGEISVLIAEKAHRRKGYGRKSVKWIMQHCHDEVDVFEVHIGMKNKPSISLFESLGFKETGRSQVFEEITMQH